MSATRRRAAAPLLVLSLGAIMGAALLLVWVPSLSRSDGETLVIKYLVALNAFLMAATVALAIAFSDARRHRSRSDVAAIAESTRLLRQLDKISLKKAELSAFSLTHDAHQSDDFLKERTADFLHLIVAVTADTFSQLLHYPCGVAIKLLHIDASGRAVVRTYLRDSDSLLTRPYARAEREGFPVDAHSPFRDIILGRTQGDYFVSNDLKAAKAAGRYETANPRFEIYYNSTLIVPIKHPTSQASQSILGFLCIDSLYGKFDEERCLFTAQIVANEIFSAVLTLSTIEARRASTDLKRA